MKTQEIIDIVKAFENGAIIQWAQKGSEIWRVASEPSWNFDSFNYRVKPEPKTIFVNEVAFPSGSCYAYPTKKQAECAAKSGRGNVLRAAVKYREVID